MSAIFMFVYMSKLFTAEFLYFFDHQSIVYHANGKQRKIDTVLSEGKRPTFRLQDYWSDFKLPVPPLPPSSSSLRTCKIIDIEYFIEVCSTLLLCNVCIL